MKKSSKKLVCFDFDNTITKDHTHNIACELKISPKYKDCGIVVNGESGASVSKSYNAKKFERFKKKYQTAESFIKDPQKIAELFEALHKEGIKIAITTFSNYFEIIYYAFEKLALSEEVKKSIIILSGMPTHNVKFCNKNMHIGVAMTKCGITDYSEVIFVDDSSKNLRYAKELGVNAIDGSKNFLDDMCKMLNLKLQTNSTKSDDNDHHNNEYYETVDLKEINAKYEVQPLGESFGSIIIHITNYENCNN